MDPANVLSRPVAIGHDSVNIYQLRSNGGEQGASQRPPKLKLQKAAVAQNMAAFSFVHLRRIACAHLLNFHSGAWATDSNLSEFRPES